MAATKESTGHKEIFSTEIEKLFTGDFAAPCAVRARSELHGSSKGQRCAIVIGHSSRTRCRPLHRKSWRKSATPQEKPRHRHRPRCRHRGTRRGTARVGAS